LQEISLNNVKFEQETFVVSPTLSFQEFLKDLLECEEIPLQENQRNYKNKIYKCDPKAQAILNEMEFIWVKHLPKTNMDIHTLITLDPKADFSCLRSVLETYCTEQLYEDNGRLVVYRDNNPILIADCIELNNGDYLVEVSTLH